MVTNEQIKQVERIQRINIQIEYLKEDYRNISDLCYRNLGYRYYNYTSQYKKVLKAFIKNKIRILKNRKRKLIKGE